ncbi:flavin reductase family protein [Peribacillus kribbensis]|uniref:flavin reductase family protein n=1 Tax=Peribacillus kribbensis TaxID=356658 RepID=UPI00047D290F|nr:flavin reductase family protein [Peribacillus kribbensis]
MDDRIFRTAMGKFATGVTVITTNYEGEAHGMTANAFMSVSLDPKLIAVSVGEKARMHDRLKETGKFAVNILADTQKEYSMYFAGQIKEKRDIPYGWIDDYPLIPDAIASILCTVYDSHKAGDHTLFLGEVQELVLREGNPLTFFEGRYDLPGGLGNKS